jgi:hypothetical protein
MTRRLIVTGPVALVTDSAGKIHYYYNGAPLPEDIKDGERDRLLESGLIGECDENGYPVNRTAESGTSTAEVSSGAVDRPLRSAPASAWVEYAIDQGMDRQEAEGLSKADLIDRLSKK